MDLDSFQGYAAKNKTFQIVNQAAKSSLLKSFKNCYYPYIRDKDIEIEVQNLCSIPILDKEKSLFALVFIYNKLDSRKKPKNFTMNDVYLMQAAGKILYGI